MHMLVENATSPWGQGTRAMNCMHLCLWKTLSQDCPHGEIRHLQSTVLTLVKMYGSDFLCEEEGKIWQMRFASFFDEYQCILSEI